MRYLLPLTASQFYSMALNIASQLRGSGSHTHTFLTPPGGAIYPQ